MFLPLKAHVTSAILIYIDSGIGIELIDAKGNDKS